jgi:hypothetical protein
VRHTSSAGMNLFSTRRYTANFERLFHQMWEVFAAHRKPRHMHVVLPP